MTLSDWANISTIIASLGALGALSYTAYQVSVSSKISRANFWLELRNQISNHSEIHLKLRNEEWSNDDEKFPPEQDWSKLEAYMGFFEHCETMLDQKLIDWATFNDIYGYRIQLILLNPIIVREKLINRRSGWKRFLKLTARFHNNLINRRYLSVYKEVTSNNWIVWWGTLKNEEGCEDYKCWQCAQTRYYDLIEELKTNGGLYCSWLKEDWKTIHKAYY
jgi:hypothetical protein